jgi:hypothetical protein
MMAHSSQSRCNTDQYRPDAMHPSILLSDAIRFLDFSSQFNATRSEKIGANLMQYRCYME